MGARIVFDLDGTLIDSAPTIQTIANAALAGVGVAPVSLKETHSFIGEGIGSFVELMRKSRNVADSYQDILLADMIARYDGSVAQTQMYPGVRKALADLSQDHRLGICTNKLHKPSIAVLERLGIEHMFASVWGGDNPLGPKPDPGPLLAAFEELGGGPCLYVGDSEVDAETAKRANVPFVLFTKGYRKSPVEAIPHTVALDDFEDLNSVVAQVLAGQ
ncbi:MAG: HAD-IA family hydrolase [Brevirhabdus sp.]